MAVTAKSLGIDRLSLAERILLVEEIWDGIAEHLEELEIQQSQKDELDRRLIAFQNDPTAGSNWPDVKARVLKAIHTSE